MPFFVIVRSPEISVIELVLIPVRDGTVMAIGEKFYEKLTSVLLIAPRRMKEPHEVSPYKVCVFKCCIIEIF